MRIGKIKKEVLQYMIENPQRKRSQQIKRYDRALSDKSFKNMASLWAIKLKKITDHIHLEIDSDKADDYAYHIKYSFLRKMARINVEKIVLRFCSINQEA